MRQLNSYFFTIFSLVAVSLVRLPESYAQDLGEKCEKCNTPSAKFYLDGSFSVCKENNSANANLVPCSKVNGARELDISTPVINDAEGHGATKDEFKNHGIQDLVTIIEDRASKAADREAAKTKLKDKLNDPNGAFRDICSLVLQQTSPCKAPTSACAVLSYPGRTGHCGNSYKADGSVPADSSNIDTVSLNDAGAIVITCSLPENFCRCHLDDLKALGAIADVLTDRELAAAIFGE